jgi:hypothetical protein
MKIHSAVLEMLYEHQTNRHGVDNELTSLFATFRCERAKSFDRECTTVKKKKDKAIPVTGHEGP